MSLKIYSQKLKRDNMTSEQKNSIAKLYFEIGELHGRVLSKDTLITLVNSFDDLNFEVVFKTMKDWLLNGTHFPLPAHIRQKILPSKNESDDISEAVNRSLAAVSKFGYCNSEQAKIYIGALGWQIIQGMGGWVHLCETLGIETPIGVMRKQMLDYGETVWKRVKRGEHNTPPELPESIINLLPQFKSID